MADSLQSVETVLQEHIFPDLLRGRKDFDLPHTKAVVHWVKQICSAESNLNHKILITAAYAHDWGYAEQFVNNPTYHNIQKIKSSHMEIGARKIDELIRTRLNTYFSKTERARVTHLVAIHDKLNEIKIDDEIALMEADTLGALDVERVKPTFSRKDNESYLEEVINQRLPLFHHKLAKEMFATLLRERKSYYNTL